MEEESIDFATKYLSSKIVVLNMKSEDQLRLKGQIKAIKHKIDSIAAETKQIEKEMKEPIELLCKTNFLSPREATILEKRKVYHWTLKQVAEHFDAPISRIRKVEQKIMQKIIDKADNLF